MLGLSGVSAAISASDPTCIAALQGSVPHIGVRTDYRVVNHNAVAARITSPVAKDARIRYLVCTMEAYRNVVTWSGAHH